MTSSRVDVHKLTRQERLDLLGELWDSLAADAEQVPLTAAQREDLDRRLDDLERNPGETIPWQEVLDRIRGRLG